jgi:hypothetical protein
VATSRPRFLSKAAREIEIAVGKRLPPPAPGEKKLYGVDVINAAFGKGKPLSDQNQEPGEQEGTRALYAGYLGTFKNQAATATLSRRTPFRLPASSERLTF